MHTDRIKDLDMRVKQAWSGVESIVLTGAFRRDEFQHPIFPNLVLSYLNQCAKNLKSLHIHGGHLRLIDWNWLVSSESNDYPDSFPHALQELCIQSPDGFSKLILWHRRDVLLKRFSCCIRYTWEDFAAKHLAEFLTNQLWHSKEPGTLTCIQFVIKVANHDDVATMCTPIISMMLNVLSKRGRFTTKLPLMVFKVCVIVQTCNEHIVASIEKTFLYLHMMIKSLQNNYTTIQFGYKLIVQGYYYRCREQLEDLFTKLKSWRRTPKLDEQVVIRCSQTFSAEHMARTPKTCKEIFDKGLWLTNCAFCHW